VLNCGVVKEYTRAGVVGRGFKARANIELEP
jgi:hypothetical protein